MRTLLILLFLLSPNLVFGQAARKVETHPPGSLVILQPETTDDARWVWDLRYPDDFEAYAEENSKLFIAMPKHKVAFTLLIVPNDTAKPLRKIRYTIKPDKVPDNEDDPPTSPTPEKYKDNPLFKAVIGSYPSIDDPNKKFFAKNLVKATDAILENFKTSSYHKVSKLMEDMRVRTAVNQDNGELIEGDQFKRWLPFRTAIRDAFMKLDEQGKLKTVKDHQVYFEAMNAGLKEVLK